MSETFLGGSAAAPAGSASAGGAKSAEGAPASSPPSDTKGAEGAAASPVWGAMDEETRGYIENKGWKEPGDALRSYRQLEEFLGADKAGRGLMLPKDEGDKEGWEKVYKALGRPEKAEEYELAGLLSQEATDPAFMATMAGTMHGAGLSKAQAQKLASAYQEHWKADVAARVAAHQADVAVASRELSAEDKENCRRGFRFLGLGNEEAAAIESYWGVKRAALLFARIGKALGEDKRVDGAGAGGFGGSAEAAQAKIAELNADPAFRKRYLEGEEAAVKQMENLYKLAAEAK